MAKRKPLTEKQRATRKAYTKELNRIKRFIKRAEERGYRFTEKVKKELLTEPTRITSASVKKLQKVKPKDLYKKARALSSEGKIITGEEKRKEERQERARKSAETRRKNRERKEAEYNVEAIKQILTNWEQDRREQDRQEQRQRESEGYSSAFYKGTIVFEQIQELINGVDINFQDSASHLREVLNNEISTYGLEKVMESISQAPEEIIDKCQQALNYKASDSRHKRAIIELVNLIRGTIPTSEEMRDMEEWTEADEWIDSLF